MKKYTVKKGRHDFRPNPFPLPGFSDIKESRVCCLDKSCHYNEATAPDFPKQDLGDINKLWGYTYAFSAKDRYSAMFGWRPDQKKEFWFEIFGYINFKDGKKDFFRLGNVQANTNFETYMMWNSKGVWLDIKLGYNAPGWNMPRPWIHIPISSWFGGNQRAPIEMILWID